MADDRGCFLGTVAHLIPRYINLLTFLVFGENMNLYLSMMIWPGHFFHNFVSISCRKNITEMSEIISHRLGGLAAGGRHKSGSFRSHFPLQRPLDYICVSPSGGELRADSCSWGRSVSTGYVGDQSCRFLFSTEQPHRFLAWVAQN